MTRSVAWIIVVAAGIVGSAASARADARTEAVMLFDEGLKEMRAGNYEKACKAFEESNARWPDSGTKGSLAKCYEKRGKLASSWLMWRELSDVARTTDLRKDAASHAAQLEPRVAKYVVKMIAQTPGLALSVNGRSAGLTDMPVPIDAGPIVAIATAPDRTPWKIELAAVDGETVTIDVPALEVPKIIVKPDDPQPPRPIPVVDHGKRRRLVGYVIGGAGVAALIGGGGFGLAARSTFSDAKKTCGGSVDNCAPDRIAAAQVQVDQARTSGTVSSILFGAGAAAVVTAVVLVVTAPAAENRVAITPIAAGNAAGFAISGRF